MALALALNVLALALYSVALLTSLRIMCINELRGFSWWFDIDRHEAEMLLMLPGNNRGTFLVRPSRGQSFAA